MPDAREWFEVKSSRIIEGVVYVVRLKFGFSPSSNRSIGLPLI